MGNIGGITDDQSAEERSTDKQRIMTDDAHTENLKGPLEPGWAEVAQNVT